MQSLIAADQTLLLWSAMLAIVAIGYWSETTPLGRRLSGVIIILAVAMLASNLRILPTASGVYDTAWGVIVPVAIPLLLAKADLRKVFSETGPLLLAFVFAAFATIVGIFVAFWLVDLGPRSTDIAGIFTATYIGGSVNFAAIAEALQITDGTLLSASVAADNVVGAAYLVLLAALPGTAIVARWYSTKHHPQASDDAGDAADTAIDFDPGRIAAALAYACAVAFAGRWLATLAGFPSFGLVTVTLLALGLATAFPRLLGKLRGEDTAGMLLMYLFFAAVGAGADISKVFSFGPAVFLFALIIVTVHFVVLMTVTRLLRLDVNEALVASNACIMGPATAAALAASQGWRELVTPSIICGSFGYGVANVIALFVVDLLS